MMYDPSLQLAISKPGLYPKTIGFRVARKIAPYTNVSPKPINHNTSSERNTAAERSVHRVRHDTAMLDADDFTPPELESEPESELGARARA
jgi:hypothetical protein